MKGFAALALASVVAASCSSTAPKTGSGKPSAPTTTIVVGAVVAERQLSNDRLDVLDVGGGAQVIVPRGAVTDGARIEVRPVNGFAGIGALTAGPLFDVAISDGKQLKPIELHYPVAPTKDAPPPVAGQYDRSNGEWTKVDSAFDPATAQLTVSIAKPSAVGYLQWDWSKALAGGRQAVEGLVASRPASDNPKCTGESEIVGMYDFAVATDSSVAWCAGHEQNRNVVRAVNRGKIPVTVRARGLAPLSKRSADNGFIDQLAAAAAPLMVKADGEMVEILAPGSELVLELTNATGGGTVRAEVDGYSQYVSSVAAAASFALSLYAGNGAPVDQLLRDDADLRAALATRLTSAACAGAMSKVTDQLHATADMAAFVGRLVTNCLDQNTMARLAAAPSKLTAAQFRNNFGPADSTALPPAFADQVTASVAPALVTLTERVGSPDLASVVISPKTSSTSSPPELPPVPTTAAPPSTTEAPTPVETATSAPPAPTSVPDSTAPTTPNTVPDTTATAVTTTTSTTAVSAPTTTAAATSTSAAKPVTIIDTMSSGLRRVNHELCAGARISQPFTVPDNVSKLTELGLGVGNGGGQSTNTFTAIVSITPVERVPGRAAILRREARINGADWSLRLGGDPIDVNPGDRLTLTVEIVRPDGDAQTVSLAVLAEPIAGVDVATESNRCGSSTDNSKRVELRTNLSVRVVGA